MEMLDVCVVIVTYNRIEKLKKALQAYEKLTMKPACFVVVDNGSDDGTAEYLCDWEQKEDSFRKIIISLGKNTGGSGGFYEGIKNGCQSGCSWIWVADDDAYPMEDAFEKLTEYMNDDYVAVCAAIESLDGIDTWHRRRMNKGAFLIREERISETEYNSCFDMQLFSYVGTMLSVKALEMAGLPEKEFFINYDDTEHSIRMSKLGKMICVPQARVYHDSPGVEADILSWKKYYAVRNKIYSYRKHFELRYSVMLSCFYCAKAFVKMVCKRDVREWQIVNKAVKDGNKGKLGVDMQYAPGWK